MRILLINPPIRWKMGRAGEAVVPPLGLLYIASSLKAGGYDVDFLDAGALSLDRGEVKKEIQKRNPDLVGLSSMTLNAYTAYQIANDLKEDDKDLPVVYGGPHASALPKEVLEECPGIDFTVIKEGEYIVFDLIDAINGKKRLEDVKGIAYRKNGEIKVNPPAPIISELDKLPFPARELLPWDRYSRVIHRTLFSKKRSMRFTSMITSRGCPFRCVYCDKSVFGRAWRGRSAENVLDEIKHVVYDYKVGDIVMHDELFTLDKKRVLKICDGIINEGLDISWAADSRVDTVDKEMLEKMHKAGCTNVFYGVESGDMRILGNIKKGIALNQVERAVKLAKDAGLYVTGSFMFGLPGETKEDARKTIEFAKKLNFDIVHFNVTTPFPGSPLYDQLKKENRILISNWADYQLHTNKLTFKHENLSSEEVSKITNRAHLEYYLRWKFIFSKYKEFIRNPVGFIRGGISLLKIVS